MLEVENGSLRIGGLPSAMAPDLLEEIRRQKEKVLAWLAARFAWEKALEEVAQRWNGLKVRHGNAPWLPGEEDDTLQEAVGEAIRSEDLEAALAAIGRWRGRWDELLRSGKSP